MNTLKYETLMLAHTEITNDELGNLESNFEKIFSEAGGKLTTFDKWGKYRLAYPVRKNSYGVYILARYELPKTDLAKTIGAVDSFLKIKCHEFVMRHVNVKLDANAPSEYQRPEPLDSSRASGLDNGKIENLLDSVDSKSSKEAPKAEAAPAEKAAAPAQEAPSADESEKTEA